MSNFEFIGSYDRRTSSGNIAAPDAHEMVKATRTRKTRQNPKKPTWEDCQALRRTMKGVFLRKDAILFEKNGIFSHFENGKMYEYKNAPQAYNALLQLQRDRLAMLSNEQAIADGIAAKELII